jgi:hydrophobic/amphiphilic exporter-1 (mainly G- bacteria), HAE1 family
LSSKRSIRLTMIMVAIFSIFSYLLVPLGLVKGEFFPKIDGDQLFISVELPPGTNIDTSKREALKIFSDLQKGSDIETVSLDLGTAQNEFGSAQGSESNNFFYSLVLKEERELSSSELAESLRDKFKTYSKGEIRVSEESSGPPAGADVQIKLLGSDLTTLNRYADEIERFLESQPGLTNVEKSLRPATSKITFIPDKQKLSENGLTADQVGLAMRTYASGFTLTSAKFNDGTNTENDITLRFNEGNGFVESLGSLNVPTPTGQQVSIISLGRLELETSPALISHEDGKRTISISASVNRGYNIQQENANLEKFANDLDLPSGYTWKTGGVNEENQRSVNSILTAMILSFLLILVTMVLQFSSFRKAFIVLLVIPLSISGVFIIFALTNTPLSFPALIGVLALFGIVVKNSILVVDKIQANEKTTMEFKEGIAEGAASRLEPIALTSLTAILGLIPVTLSDPLWRGLGGAIIAGLTFSGTIMLFFIPVVYYLIFRPKEIKRERRVSRKVA